MGWDDGMMTGIGLLIGRLGRAGVDGRSDSGSSTAKK